MFLDGTAQRYLLTTALYGEFYAKYRRIEPEQATQMQESSLGHECIYKIQTFNDNVRSLVHCKI